MIGIVICHKSLAKEITATARSIVGHQHNLFPFSNDKIESGQLVKEVETLLASYDNPENVVIMVDLRGGNCWAVAKMIARNHPGYHVLSGVNMPMVFSFLTKKDNLLPDELIESLEKDAHRGIVGE